MTASPVPTEEHLGLLYQELKGCLDKQVQELASLDQKTAILLAANGVLIGLLISDGGKIGTGPASAIAIMMCAGLLTAGWALGAFNLLPRRIKTAPVPSGLWPEYWDKGSQDMLGDLCATVAEAHARNDHVSGRKLRWFQLQLGFVMAALLILLITYIASVGGIVSGTVPKSGATPATTASQRPVSSPQSSPRPPSPAPKASVIP